MAVDMQLEREKTRCPRCRNLGRVSGDNPSEICVKCAARAEAEADAYALRQPRPPVGALPEPRDPDDEPWPDGQPGAGYLTANEVRQHEDRSPTEDTGAASASAAEIDAAPGTDDAAGVDALPLEEQTIAELRDLASYREVDLTGRRRKADIIAALEEAAHAD